MVMVVVPASAYLGSQSYEPFPPAGFTPDYTGDRVSGQGEFD